MSVTSTETVIAALSIRSLGSSFRRRKDSHVRDVYKQASQSFLQRDFADAFETLQLVLLPRSQLSEEEDLSAEEERLVAPIATATRNSRIKVWSLYLTLLNAIIELGPDEGKAAVGSKQWRDIAAKARDGSIWDEVVRIGYGGEEGNVDIDVVFNLANLLLSQSASQTKNQQHLETYLATSDLSRTPRPDQYTPNDTTNNLRDLTSRIKILELYILHVLPANEEWDYAKDFIQMSDILDDDHKEAFQQALEGLKTEETQSQQPHGEEQEPPQDLQPAEPRPLEDHDNHPTEHRRSNSEQDYGIEDPKRAAAKPKELDLHPVSRAKPKSSLQRNGKSIPSKTSPKRPSNAGIIRRSMALIAAFQNLISNMTQSLSKNPLAILRFVLFVVALLVALGRRDVKERIQRMTGSGWDKVRKTVGMGVKVSYI